MEPSVALLSGIRRVLLEDQSISDVIGDRVWDDIPDIGSEILFPYITLVESSSSFTFMQDIDLHTYYIQIHIWSRHDNGTSTEARTLRGLIYNALHSKQIDIEQPASVSNATQVSQRIFRDSDGQTWHAINEFKFQLEIRK